jgi:hypothetical protein
VADGLTISEGAAVMTPPMPRRELARRLKGVEPLGSTWGRKGRRAAVFPVDAILRAHAEWVGECRGQTD